MHICRHLIPHYYESHCIRLRDENVGMAEKLKILCEEGEKREKTVLFYIRRIIV